MASPSTTPARTATTASSAGRRRDPLIVGAALAAVALATWIVLVARMRGMDMGPGTDLGGLGWYLGIWVTMTVAMMLPSSAPTVLLVVRVERRQGRLARIPLFVGGYLVAWTAYGAVAYGIFRALRAAWPAALMWDGHGPLVAGTAVAAAGLYQLTPLKRACLRHCRSPLHFVMHGYRSGYVGALRMGVEHGAVCVGCCFGLMVILWALGIMSLFWMGLVAGAILAEKTLPWGDRLPRVIAPVLVGLGVWVAAAPATVPGLTQSGMPMMP